MKAIERPLDLLNGSKGKKVILRLKNDRTISGILLAFDININLVLDDAQEADTKLGLMFIRGDSVIYVSPAV